jgi:pimeloyl-ACP methyl ester carboxylesterase
MSEDLNAGAPTATPHDLSVRGIRLHYGTWGDPSSTGRAVLLIHGITANHTYMAALGQALAARGRYAIAADLRGRGLSDKPAHGYGIPFHADDLLALCDALGLSAVDLVGHSLGAHIALFLAGIHSQRAGKVVLVDGGGAVPADARDAIASSVKRLEATFPSLDAYLAALRQAAPFPWDPFWERYYRYDAEVRADGSVTSRMSQATFEEEWAVMLATRTEALPGLVRAPTLIVRAGLGTLGPDRGRILPAEEAERMHGAIPGSQLAVIPDTNHYTVLLADAFERQALAFLEEPASA